MSFLRAITVRNVKRRHYHGTFKIILKVVKSICHQGCSAFFSLITSSSFCDDKCIWNKCFLCFQAFSWHITWLYGRLGFDRLSFILAILPEYVRQCTCNTSNVSQRQCTSNTSNCSELRKRYFCFWEFFFSRKYSLM